MRETHVIDRSAALEWFRRNRRRSEDLFALIPDAAYYDRPIALRNPICFYEGHIPAFGINTLWKRALGGEPIDARFEKLFERGIDPEEEALAGGSGAAWPSRPEIRRYGEEADRRLREAIAHRPLVAESTPMLRKGQALYTVLEHEVMHQETLHYMWRRQPYERKRARDGAPAPDRGSDSAPARRTVIVPTGTATLGADRSELPFGWDNEFPRQTWDVAAFEVDVDDVTNQDFLEFMEAGGYGRADLWDPDGWKWVQASGVAHPPFWVPGERGFEWLGMFERIPLPASWPAWVTHAEASAFAKWRGGRLMTEAEYHRAAFGESSGRERDFPWGGEPPDATRGNFDFAHWEPVPVGSYPTGASAWGIRDLVGNGWEWTSSVFEGFPGFEPMASYPQYSADFFDGKHFVMKGASPVTGRELVRRSFRNWFRPNYPHVYAAFRVVKPATS